MPYPGMHNEPMEMRNQIGRHHRSNKKNIGVKTNES